MTYVGSRWYSWWYESSTNGSNFGLNFVKQNRATVRLAFFFKAQNLCFSPASSSFFPQKWFYVMQQTAKQMCHFCRKCKNFQSRSKNFFVTRSTVISRIKSLETCAISCRYFIESSISELNEKNSRNPNVSSSESNVQDTRWRMKIMQLVLRGLVRRKSLIFETGDRLSCEANVLLFTEAFEFSQKYPCFSYFFEDRNQCKAVRWRFKTL